MKNRTYAAIVTLSLIIGLLMARSEIVSILAAQENQDILFSISGLLTIVLYSAVSIAGLLSLLAAFWSPKPPGGVSFVSIRWLAFMGALLILAWTYLYSPWQFILAGAWTQLIAALGFAQFTSLLLSPNRNKTLGWGELALALSVFLLPRLVNDVRLLTDSSLISRAAALSCYGFITGLALVLYHPMGERVSSFLRALRERLGKVRWWVIVFLWCVPILYHYAFGAEINAVYANLRFAVLLVALWIAAFLGCEYKDRILSTHSLVIHLGMLVLASAVDGYLMSVVGYPFGLYWSEGNRLYDYSLVFGQSLYDHPGTIVNPYSSPGRYGLWGVMFLFKDAPIWMHRLWNLILQIVPPLLFAALLTRKIQPDNVRRQVMIWTALFFIVLAPLHPPFMVASIIAVWFAFDESPVKRGIAVLVAGYYVAISRFTWAFAPAAMGALIDLLLYYPHRTGNWFRRLVPAAVMAVLGMTPGLLINFATFRSTVQGDSLTGSQPLLWYRLLPNPTLGPGVLLLTLLYTSPLLILIAWWMYTKQWKLDAWQKLAVWGALLGFLAAGLVISTKIGGGGDLHNLDMYLVTLMLVAVLGFTDVSKKAGTLQLPAWAVGLTVLMILFPLYHYTPLNPSASGRVGYADAVTAQEVLSTIRNEVETASRQGEVLFMDQRQLLTFGYIPAIPFIPEYEKKYMMDQAMAGNPSYFKLYYQDLAKKRFTLIVTEVLRSKLKSDMGGPFSEENDVFVTWVSNPTLCFYKPIYTSRETNIMLLVPRSDVSRCEEYLK